MTWAGDSRVATLPSISTSLEVLLHRTQRRPSWLRPAIAAAVIAPALVLTTLPGANAAEPPTAATPTAATPTAATPTAAAPIAATPAAATPAGAETASAAVLTFQVRAAGDAGALALDLLAAGYDVAGRHGDVLYVLGTASTATTLRARPDLTVVGSEPAAPADLSADSDQVTLPPAGSQDDLLPTRLRGRTYETFYGGYRTVDGFQRFEEDLAAAYPTLVQLVEYGESYTGDNPLRALCVTTKADQGCRLDPDTDKARFVFMAQIHARELTTSEMTWRFLTYLVDGKGRRADVTALLDDAEIWVVPETNPDGIETVEKGIQKDGLGSFSNAWQRKNRNPGDASCGTGSSSQIGVDLNRNWDASWGGAGTSGVPCSLVYRGTSAASEPETSDLAALLRQLFEDQRGAGSDAEAPPDTRGALLTLHTYSNLVLFPYGSGDDAPNDAGLRSMAFRMSHYNGYETGRPNEILYEVTGSTDDWAYQVFGVAAFTYEIGPGSGTCGGFFPAYSCQDTFWELNREAIMYNATAAQQPYTQGLGPTIVKAKSKLDGKTVRITGTADDDAYGKVGVDRPSAQNVVQARLFIGSPPWEGGKARPVALDSSGKKVDFSAELTAKKQDRKVYLQAKDADGNWGPVEVVWRKPLA